MSGAERSLAAVAADLERLAVAAGPPGPSRDRVAARARELAAEAHRIGREGALAQSRKSLAAAWAAWLGLALSVELDEGKSLLEEALDFEPALRGRFREFLGGRPAARAPDAYPDRLATRIRQAAGEVWDDEAARDGFIRGLVTARQEYTGANPGVPYAVQLADVLGPGFEAPAHADGCRGHRHGLGGCLARGCACKLRPARAG